MLYIFGDRELDAERLELWADGHRVTSRPQVLRALCHLIEHRDRTVARAELESLIWPDLAISQNSFNNLVFEARQAIGDDGRSQRWIRTLRGEGHRFVGHVETAEPGQPIHGDGAERSAPDRLRAAFLGRDKEIEQLERALSRAEGGHANLVLVAGEMGLGKSRLVHELSKQARSRGFRVAIGRSEETVDAPSYWPWIQVLRGVLDDEEGRIEARRWVGDAHEVARLLIDVGSDAAQAEPGGRGADGRQGRFRLFDALSRLLASLSKQRPTLVVIEDLHSSDEASLQLLHFVARTFSDENLLVVATLREAEIQRSDARRRILDGIGSVDRVEDIALTRLGAEAVRDLLEIAYFDEPDAVREPTVPAVVDITGGNPLFLIQLLQAGVGPDDWMQLAPRGSKKVALPLTLRGAITQHLSTLPRRCRDALTIASVLGREFDLSTIASVSTSHREALLEALEPALETGTVQAVRETIDSYRFTHILVRDVVYEALGEAEASVLHLRVAEAREQQGRLESRQRVSELAHHFYMAARLGADERAATYARLAAEHAMTRHGHEEAVLWYERAIQLLELSQQGTNDAARCDLLIALIEAKVLADGRTAGDASLGRAVALARRASDDVRLARAILARFSGRASQEPTPVYRAHTALFREALDRSRSLDRVTRSRLLSTLAKGINKMVPSDLDDRILASIDEVDGVDTEAAVALNLSAARAWLTRRPDDIELRQAATREVVRLADALGDEETGLEFRRIRIAGDLQVGDIASAERGASELSQRARSLNIPQAMLTVHSVQAGLSLVRGDLSATDRHLEQILWLAKRYEEPVAREHHAAHGAALLFHRDAIDSASHFLDAGVADSGGDHVWKTALPLVYALTGRSRDARRALDALSADRFAEAVAHGSNWLFAGGLLSDACATLHDLDTASLLLELLEAYHGHYATSMEGTLFWGPMARPLGRLAATLGDRERARKYFESALAMSNRIDSPLWLAHSQKDYAAMLLERGALGDRRRAGELVAEAAATAERHGFKWLQRTLSIAPFAETRH